MKKKDLKTGMRAELRNGDEVFVYSENGVVCFPESDGSNTDNITDDLCDYQDSVFDVIKIFDIPTKSYEFFNIEIKGELIWERKEEKPICEIDGVEYSESTLRSLIKKAHK